MIFKRRSPKNYLLISVILIVVYNEFLAYHLQPWFWKEMACSPNKNNESECTKILFIADPQIQGVRVVPVPLQYLLNWDSDRYVKMTFSVAFEHFDPDVIVFLGDITDEGSISTKEEFHQYVKRLMNIFDTQKTVMHVWIPGDNDIGGENEPIKRKKIEEFNEAFNQPDVMQFRNISIYKVNTITHTIPKIPNELVGEKRLNIVVSHHPILKSVFSNKVVESLNPDIFFSAHDHTAQINTLETGGQRHFKNMKSTMQDGVLYVKFKDGRRVEIVVPTCSYRMGVYEMGYGAAVFENNADGMKYQVLWSPSRFPKIFFYLFVIILSILYLALCCVYKIGFSNSNTSNRYSQL